MLLREIILSCIILLSGAHSQQIPNKDHSKNQYFTIESDLSVTELEKLHPDWVFEYNARGLPNHYVFSKPFHNGLQKRSNFENSDGVISFHDMIPYKLHKRVPPMDDKLKAMMDIAEEFNIKDPLFKEQWHIMNPWYKGNDVNVTQLWRENVTGKNVTVAIVDDGVEYENQDLKDNFCYEGSWDFNDNTALPKPRLFDDYHGTRCAGEIAGAKNDYCGVGVAYDARISGLRILSGSLTIEDEAASLIYGLDYNDIFSCSWGPPDDGKHLQAPNDLVKKAIIKGTQEGRKGKGVVYVFASGNGAMWGDNCNYDGYTNSIFSITVGAIDHKGLHPLYSESCSAVMVVTTSSGSGKFIETTDINGKCSTNHGGTSAAAPLASGVYALLLEANPNLTWRDVQYLSILSSAPIENKDGQWQMGAMGRLYSHMYGYGVLDAYNLVEMGKTWKNVNPQEWHYTKKYIVEKSTEKPDDMIESIITVTGDDLKNDNIKALEHIQIIVNIEANIRGQVTIDLISPSGMVSKLGVVRPHDEDASGFNDWTFMSVAHWGESEGGDWKLQVKTHKEGNKVKLNNWRMKMFGEAIDGSKVGTYFLYNDKEITENPIKEEDAKKQQIVASTSASQTTSLQTEENKQTDIATQSNNQVQTSATSKVETPAETNKEEQKSITSNVNKPSSSPAKTDKPKESTKTDKPKETSSTEIISTSKSQQPESTTKTNNEDLESISQEGKASEPKETATPTENSQKVTAETSVSAEDDVNIPNKIPVKQKTLHYFVSLFAIGIVIVILYMMFFMKTRRRIRRTRAEAFEFDIIDTDSDYDSTFDNTLMSGNGAINEPIDIDDLEFDLSDEEDPSEQNNNTDNNLTNPFDDPLYTVHEGDEESEAPVSDDSKKNDI